MTSALVEVVGAIAKIIHGGLLAIWNGRHRVIHIIILLLKTAISQLGEIYIFLAVKLYNQIISIFWVAMEI